MNLDIYVLHTAFHLSVSQLASYGLCCRLYPSHFGRPLGLLLALALSSAAVSLCPLWASASLIVLALAACWNVATAILLFGFRAALTAFFGWDLCLLAALVIRALIPITDAENPFLVELILAAVWLFATGIMLRTALVIVRAMRGEKTNWARFLLHISSYLEFVAIGIFSCRVLTANSPFAPFTIAVALLLGMSYLFLLSFHSDILQDDIRAQKRRKIIQSKLQEQEQEFAAWAAVLASARRMRHDFGNHAVVAQNLADSGKVEEALTYLENVRRAWEQDLSGVELQTFGRLSGILMQNCAACGIVLRISGSVPKEQGIRSQRAYRLLNEVAQWAIRLLRGRENAVLEMHLCGPVALECRLEPAELPAAGMQDALRQRCAGNRIDFREDGQALRLRLTGFRQPARTDCQKK